MNIRFAIATLLVPLTLFAHPWEHGYSRKLLPYWFDFDGSVTNTMVRWTLRGFAEAARGSIPFKEVPEEGDGDSLAWTGVPAENRAAVVVLNHDENPTVLQEPDPGDTEKSWFLTAHGSGSLSWEEGASLPPDERSVTTNKSDHGAVGDGVLSIYGFDLSGRRTGSVPYRYDQALEWADPPNGVTADKPKVLTFNGSTVAWGDNSAGKYDQTSITTNYADGAVTANEASIYGFRYADKNSIPYKSDNGSSGAIDWLPPPTGATSQNLKFLQFNGSLFEWGDATQTIRFIGTDGTAVDVGDGTNVKEVTFASASDSNVTVSCEPNGVGGAKITIGVYWYMGSNE